LSQFDVVPVAGDAPVCIGSGDCGGSFFEGATAKVAVYDYALEMFERALKQA
jgi:hypothetical protein